MKNSKNQKKGKYANELEKLRELNAIKEVLKKGDIENAALTNTSKDSETVSDTVVDNMLSQLQIDKNSNRDLEIVESLTANDRRAGILKNIRAKQKKSFKKAAAKKKPMKKTAKKAKRKKR